MTYDQAVNAVKNGLTVTDGKSEGVALKIIVLFGADYIVTNSKDKVRNFSIKDAELS